MSAFSSFLFIYFYFYCTEKILLFCGKKKGGRLVIELIIM